MTTIVKTPPLELFRGDIKHHKKIINKIYEQWGKSNFDKMVNEALMAENNDEMDFIPYTVFREVQWVCDTHNDLFPHLKSKNINWI
jgi:hypothetical protein